MNEDAERTGNESEPVSGDAGERRMLWWALGINMSQVALAGGVGVIAHSTGLLGTALDSMSDAGVYAISLFAVGRSVAAKARAARLSGIALILLGLGLMVEVVRRFFVGSEPIGMAMIAVAVVNTATNFVIMRLLGARREQGVHLNASWIFTANDMIANAGIVLSGLAIMAFKSPVPDLVIGLAVAAIGIQGGREILEQARDAEREAPVTTEGGRG
jgi:Co/Zn/Cd efflux system component